MAGDHRPATGASGTLTCGGQGLGLGVLGFRVCNPKPTGASVTLSCGGQGRGVEGRRGVGWGVGVWVGGLGGRL